MRCLSVTPGNFDTPMGALESGQADVFKKYSALKRNGKPEEIAALFALLLDERLGFLTGADILMDGGVVASGAQRIEQIKKGSKVNPDFSFWGLLCCPFGFCAFAWLYFSAARFRSGPARRR